MDTIIFFLFAAKVSLLWIQCERIIKKKHWFSDKMTKIKLFRAKRGRTKSRELGSESENEQKKPTTTTTPRPPKDTLLSHRHTKKECQIFLMHFLNSRCCFHAFHTLYRQILEKNLYFINFWEFYQKFVEDFPWKSWICFAFTYLGKILLGRVFK